MGGAMRNSGDSSRAGSAAAISNRRPRAPARLAWRLVAASLATVSAVATSTTPAAARVTALSSAGVPPIGKTLLGAVGPDIDAFESLTHHRQLLHLTFGSTGSGAVALDMQAGRIPIVSIEPGASMRDVAAGRVDAMLLSASAAYNALDWPVWVRPMPEMNGHWSPDCAVTAGGAPRAAAYSAVWFRKAFARITIIMHAGSPQTMNAKLRAHGVPALAGGTGGIARSGKVLVMWNPQGVGSPDVAGNHTADYWPGPASVDIVADDVYSIRFNADFPDMDAMYARYGGKPFVVAEWAPWGTDDPAFVGRMFAWAAAHPRTAGLVYFDRGWSGGKGTFRLATKPRSLAVYRSRARAGRYLTRLP
jgi:hypothetical protein